ncbi:helix-turn-helix domain-containing protein [Telluria beijingensis]|uniref:helix-turn-helix domain-containing protein n=1 Tax=Telluria beijingensis TaxID=3068633 RepID=UPI002795C4A0|nr:helix-turn-helix domain-containing protein [Massilia sp. REN29]
MTQAVPVHFTGRFRKRPVAAPLGASFSHVWTHRIPALAPPVVITPDATVDLQWMDGAFRIAGPDRDPLTETVAPGTTVIGFRFSPAAAAAWLGVPLAELVGQRLALDDLWGRKARRLADAVRAQDDPRQLAASLETLLARQTVMAPPDPAMQAAYRMIARGVPVHMQLLPWLMRALGMSERTLRRRFGESFGYGPRTLERILRYQRFLRSLRAPTTATGALAALALDAGYADQAHLVRESRRLSGYTPGQWQRLADR